MRPTSAHCLRFNEKQERCHSGADAGGQKGVARLQHRHAMGGTTPGWMRLPGAVVTHVRGVFHPTHRFGTSMTQSVDLPVAHSGSFLLGGERRVYRLGFGAMRLTGKGIWGEPRDHDEAIAVLRRALELGVTLIDTADSYGPAVSERLIAEALYPYPPELVIATKAGLERPGPDRWTPNGRPEHLRAACESSLRRLKLERIELYQLHRIDPAVSLEDQLGTLRELQHQGKIRHIGLSECPWRTSSGLASSCRSSRCRTGTTSSSAARHRRRSRCSIIASARASPSSRGSHSWQVISRSRAGPWRASPDDCTRHRRRWRSRGCSGDRP